MFRFMNFCKRLAEAATDLFQVVTVMLTTALGAVIVLMKIRVALQAA